MLQKFSRYVLLTISLLSTTFAQGEIEKVTAIWSAWHFDLAACKGGCAQIIHQQLMRLPGAAEVLVKEAEGRAEIRWKPGVPFSYGPLDNAMRIAGPAIDTVRLRVRGMITHDARNVFLMSIGDNTRFYLLGPLVPSTTQMVISENVATHPLTVTLRSDLLQAQQNHQVVTIEGPLLLPEQSPPLYLIVERLQIAKPEKQSPGDHIPSSQTQYYRPPQSKIQLQKVPQSQIQEQLPSPY